jgi:oligopeptide transport system substrate-binding protein
MPEIKFYLSDDANNMLTNYKNGDWLLIDDVPTNDIAALKSEYPEEFVVAGQIGTYYVSWNINESILPASSTLKGAEAEAAEAEIRSALALVIDRNYIVNTISQAGSKDDAAECLTITTEGQIVALGKTQSTNIDFENLNTYPNAVYAGYISKYVITVE